MILKNDKERIQFLEDRDMDAGWYIWKKDDDLGRRFWRYDTEDGRCAIIAEERMMTSYYPNKGTRWRCVRWYLPTRHDVPFEDLAASRTMALEYIRHLREFSGGIQ